MAILFDSEAKRFTLQTRHTAYQMIVGAHDYLLHLYYGAKIDNDDLSYLLQYSDRGFSGNPYEAGRDRTFSLDTQPQEFPVFGMGDFRSSCLNVVNADGSFDVELKYISHEVYQGKRDILGLPGAYGKEDEVETLVITLADSVTGFKIFLHYSVFERMDVITRHVTMVGGTGGTKLLKAYSMCLDLFTPGEYDMIRFYGKHTLERMVNRSSLNHGVQSVGSVRGCSSHQYNPFVILCDHDATEDGGACYGVSMAYSGNFKMEAELDQYQQVRLVAGIHEQCFEWFLGEGETFETPEVVLAYSKNGLTRLSYLYQRFIREHICRGTYQKTSRPVLVNNWEATYFDFTKEKLVHIAKDAKELGIDMLVMDDGWFGERNDDFKGLGDWIVNEKKLDGGLGVLTDEVTSLGLKFGIWFEPEMVNQDSDLYRGHPEWCLKTPTRGGSRSRYQYVLDLTREDVQEYLYESIAAILRQADISYVKWDMNRHLTNVYSVALPSNRQGEVYHRYVLGVYALLERLTCEFSHVLFEGCSGGGGRFDIGMLYYTPQIWCSDNTDAIERLKIQYGTSFGYPICTVGSHVSAVPNHQTGRVTPIETRAIVAMSGTFGYELDLNALSDGEKEEIKTQLSIFHRYYEVFQYGKYYRLGHAMKEERFSSWQFVSENKEQSILSMVLLKPECNAPVIIIHPKGLCTKSRYEVSFVYGTKDAKEKFETEKLGCCASGVTLMNAGIRMPDLIGDYASIMVVFNKMG